MISRKRVKEFNKILTCLLCKGYLIEATTINKCMHTFCRSCIVKHIKLFETCPICECEIRLGDLRPDIRLRSIIYKIIPGLYAKERQRASCDGLEHRILLNGASSNGAYTLVNKHEKQTFDICCEDEILSKQYFYDPEEPISLSLEYHMESIFGTNISSISNNIPQVRYLQAPAAFKVLHLKKFLSSKYDLSNLKKPMCIDIIYEGDVLSDEFSLMDIAYTYNWEREAPLKLFYRIYKSKKHSNNNEINLIKKALINQPFVKLSSRDFRSSTDSSSQKMSDAVNGKDSPSSHHNGKRMNANLSSNSHQQEQPRHDLKIIIAKKPSSKNSRVYDVSNNNSQIKLNKPNNNNNNNGSSSNSNYISKVLNDCERLRGDADNDSTTSSEVASSSSSSSSLEKKATLSKKTGTVSHHDLKYENNKNGSSRHNNSNNDSHDYYEGEKERQRESKHNNSHHTERFRVKANIPKLKIELPSLKTKITVPKTPNESYSISKSPFSNNAKCEPQIKKVRFDMTGTKAANEKLYDFNNDDEMEALNVDQKRYAERIGLKPVERKVVPIILHRKRKKSKHSRDIEHSSSKKQKLHVSSSLDDESLKLKLKIKGGKSNEKRDKRINNNNNEDEGYEQKIKNSHKSPKHDHEKHKEAVFELENHKYSVTEKISSDSTQPMVFIPKLVLQKTTSVANTFTASSTENSSNNNSSNNNSNSTTKEESTKVQRRNSIYSDQQQQQKKQEESPSHADKSRDLKIKIKTLDKLAECDSNSISSQQKLMKPPTAKMGSPSSDIQAQISSTLASSPIRPNSIPASLKLSPITATAASPTISVKSELQLQNFKRSLSLGAEKSPHCYINPYAKSNTDMFTRDPPMIEIPPLIPTSSTIRNFYSNNNSISSSNDKLSSVTISKVPNINVKDPMKLFPNACPSVEILKIPQTSPIINKPSVKNIKLNRQTIPLEKIKQTAQNPSIQKILPKSLQSTQNFLKSGYQGGNRNLPFMNDQIGQDLTLDRYQYELAKDIAKLDLSLSLEKNFEHWGKQKLQEFSKISDLKSFASSSSAKSLLNQQNINLSVRNIPNPSALMMFRNQASNSQNNLTKSKSQNSTATGGAPIVKETVSSSTNDACSDIEEILSKSTISKGIEKPFSEKLSTFSPPAKINDKKSIEKLTEYLRLTATAAKSKELLRQGDDNNNNNHSSSKNDRNFNLIDCSKQKPSSMDVICIDS